MYISKRKLRPREPEELGELNIVPYLDILMNLILFMMMSITGLAAFGILNVSAPNYGGPSAAAQDNGDKPQQLLTVLITPKGFVIAGQNAVVGTLGADGAAQAAAPGQEQPTIPKLANGNYNFKGLRELMTSLKGDPNAGFAEQSKIIIGADATIAYDVLIRTMDSVRGSSDDPKKQLFPDVTLGAM